MHLTCNLMVRKWSTVPISLSYTTPPVSPHARTHARTHAPTGTPWFTTTGTHAFTTSGTSTLMTQHHLHHVDESTPTAPHSLITRFFNNNTVRNFPTHGQLSAAQGSPTSVSTSTLPYLICLNPRLCSLMVRKWSTVPISLSYTTPTAS